MSKKKIVNRKRIITKNLIRLEEYEEIIGILRYLSEEEGELIAVFQMEYQIVLPNDTHKLRKQLNQMIGNRIGILNADNRYIVRRIKEKTKRKEIT